jgi:hypothetical protein
MRNDVYKTDCKCKKHYFQNFNEAVKHLEQCKDAWQIFYNSPYGNYFLVKEKAIEKGI